MTYTPNTPTEIKALNTTYYRTLHDLFERLSHTQPELNKSILSFLDDLNSSHQAQLMNILYQLEIEHHSLKSCPKNF